MDYGIVIQDIFQTEITIDFILATFREAPESDEAN